MKEASFYIDGMSCSACSSGIERALSRKPYCQKIQVNLLTQQAQILYDERQISLEEIFTFITRLGYTPSLQNPACNDGAQDDAQNAGQNSADFSSQNVFLRAIARFNALDSKLLPPKLRLILSIIFTLFVLVLSFGAMFVGHIFSPKIDCALMLIASLCVMHFGRAFYFKGFKALFKGIPTMDSLVALGTSAAFLYSLKGSWEIFIHNAHMHLYFESVCVILCFIMIGKFIESSAKNSAKQSASALLELYQKKVQVRKSSAQWEEMPLERVKVGDEIRILPGDVVMLDGVVIEGQSSIDTSSINGESLPVAVKSGDLIESGSINIEGSFILRAQKVGKDTLLSQIISLIQQANEVKAPLGILADKVAGIFVPIVICIAFVAGIFWFFLQDFERALDVFVSVLVISCPCALGLATPMAFLHARAVANKMGVFFKTSASLQALSQTTHLIFDKTGTLTSGLSVEKIALNSAQSKLSKQDFLSLIFALEQHSAHIIAKTITDYIQSALPQSALAEIPKVADFQSVTGFGIKGTINGQSYILGSLESLESLAETPFVKETLGVSAQESKDTNQCDRILESHQPNNAECAREAEAKRDSLPRDDTINSNSKLIIYLADSQKVLGALYLEDLLRQDCAFMLQEFSKKGIKQTMLTGDREASAQYIAQKSGISEVIFQAKPQDKLKVVNEYKKSEFVAFVGDGVNDAAALKSANVSLAYASGNDIAQNCADILLYNQNAKAILNAYNLARATITNIKQNLFWAFGYNALFIPIACGVLAPFGIFLDPMFCAFAMSLSSISVVTNAARLRRFKVV
ncbi:copper-translocating P-type ATPase [Helicobacter sp. MIT 00-7814]|uniref:heavy metal translocating P-type ATPase n=1 Tax=unclassified Helicobacter TaxID=2593540 RepID=UPI000E1F700D|nr:MULTISPECIES: heavy metal translocating P-type ATPase [unclassified Helicobacter]RDU53694.1 copper-translocating P-type ATPase [Helicobacter sp. MIT 99-10781]RDU54080.1 copper-translocating P-type ATPase [Helicobacter sp. MIT 00-7814]